MLKNQVFRQLEMFEASWLNIIESFFSKMVRGVLREIKIDSINELKEQISRYIPQFKEIPLLENKTV